VQKKTLNLTQYFFFLVAFLCVCISVWGMYATLLFDEDEGFLAETARNTVATKNYLAVVVNQEIRFDKPYFCFWLAAFSLKLFGNNELAVRLPSFIFFLLFVHQIYRFCCISYSRKIAGRSVYVSFGMLQFQLLSKAAIADNILNFFLATALFQAYYFLENNQKKHLFWFYTCLGLAFLTKGPVAFVIPALIIGGYLLVQYKLREILKILYVIFLPWFYLQFQISGSKAFTSFFVEHNLGRFISTMESHGGQWYYYIPVLLVGFLPFLHLLFRNVWLAVQSRNPTEVYLFIWFMVPVVFFSFSKTQLPHYIIYGYAPVIILMSGFHGAVRLFRWQYV
jgi:4-amino-4-deoxy-L-arabinose transferase-like glycosyltransferase